MNKREDKVEDLTGWTIKQLDDLDEADDATMAWAKRDPIGVERCGGSQSRATSG